MKKVLYLASLPTSNLHFETNSTHSLSSRFPIQLQYKSFSSSDEILDGDFSFYKNGFVTNKHETKRIPGQWQRTETEWEKRWMMMMVHF